MSQPTKSNVTHPTTRHSTTTHSASIPIPTPATTSPPTTPVAPIPIATPTPASAATRSTDAFTLSPNAFTVPEPRTRLRPRSIGGVHLNVEIYGPDTAPTVILIHGWTCSIPFWAPVINALSHDLRVVAFDLRGHGASDIPGQGQYSVQALVDDLTTVLDAALPAGQKAVLVGHSMGGMTIMAAALRPSILDRTHAVLLASTGFTDLTATARIFPSIHSRKWRVRATRHVMGSKLPLGPVSPLSRSMFKYGTLGPQSSKELATYNARILHACTRHSRAAWAQVLDHLELGDAVRHLTVPTAVLVGTADRLTPPIQSHRIVNNLPHCEGLTELPGTGHMTPLEAPDTVVNLIRKLIERHAEVAP